MTHDVFISYSTKDKNVADSVCSILEKKEIRCWIAPRDITPGVPFAEAIIDGIKGSRVFILVYSSNSNHSHQVIKEVDRAVHHGLAIIPLRLEDVPMSKQLEYYVSDVHWLDALTPPLENHINKLSNVVQMLLTMDEVDKEDIEEVLKNEDRKLAKPGRNYKLRRFLIPLIATLTVIITIGGLKIFKRQANIRWAREVALPEIELLIEENDAWRNLVKPHRLAEQAEAILGNDPRLAELFSQISLKINVRTEPAGANVYMKEYGDTVGEWTYLGVTPLDSIRVPIGIFRWRLEKEGYETILGAASTWRSGSTLGKPGIVVSNNFIRPLDLTGSIPPGMVRVTATETDVGLLGDFFIGKYEVTNREYKTFVDAGGYQKREYWKHNFIKDGYELTWEEAMREFLDQYDQPGPSTWLGGYYREGQDDYPVSGVSWYEAAAYAEWAGMSLPTSVHWEVARGGFTPMILTPQLGGFGIFVPFTNFGGLGTVPVGSLTGVTAYGAFDMPGNVREWCWNETESGKIIRGGSWEDNTYEFSYERQAPPFDRSPRNGLRLALYPDSVTVPETAFGFRTISYLSDYKIQPQISDAIFQVYKEQFAYDPGEMNPTIETREESPEGWIHERVSFNAAYGKERVLAHLFLPANIQPPYQTVIYFPGGVSRSMPSSEGIERYYEFTMFLSYLVKNGRAVLYPIYKGTFERGGPEYIDILSENTKTYAYTELITQIIKDFRRSIDYLLTRPDNIDSNKIAYYGMSWGAEMGLIIPAVENRLQASVLLAGGLVDKGRQEVNLASYLSRVRTPTLMLNGKYDVLRPPEISSKQMFNLLGTPIKDKDIKFYDTDHIPPRAEYIKETLDWLKNYLGPVR